MSAFRFILKTLRYHWRSNLALAWGVAAGTAVLAGALLVGDSMRASLRRLTLDRLGRIDEALVVDQFFRAALAEELAGRPEFAAHFAEAVPAILLRASLEHPRTQGEPRRANRVNLVGCDERFWGLGSGGPDRSIGKHQVVLNEPLARQLGVGVGDRVMVRLARVGAIPADSPLGRKAGTVESYALEVGAVVPARGLGRFRLQASQQEPRNAYVSLAWLQDRLGQPGKANAILVAGPDAQREPPPESEGVLQRLLAPALADYGIRITRAQLGYFSITSERMLLDPVAEAAMVRSLSGLEVQPALTYLANTIACREREIPYSTVAAVDFAAEPPLGPLVGVDGKPLGPLADDQIVLNDWAAEDLQARPGDAIRLKWFEPETLDGQVREQSAVFRLAAVARLAGAAADPAFTPEVPGLTDKASIDQWDPPFPFDARRIRPKDDRYWRDHRATPKAFVSRAAGKVWESRFGRVTSLRVRPRSAMTEQDLEKRIVLDPAAMGFVFQPVKRHGLAASKGTTPFDVLFLLFSAFLIAAAVMLVILLFRLGVDRRAEQLGILLAVGIERRQVVRWLAIEGLIVAALASALGLGLALGYAAGLLAALRTLWQSAVGTTRLELSATPTSLAIGYASGVFLAMLAIFWAMRRAGRLSPRQLLAGESDEDRFKLGVRPRRAQRIALGLLASAVGLSLAGAGLGEQARAGAFFGAGALVLAGTLVGAWFALRTGSTGAAVAAGRGNLPRLAVRNASRHPARSTLCIGLVAAASFLIVAVSGFRLDPAAESGSRATGSGGFALVAQSDLAIHQDVGSAQGRLDLGFSPQENRLLEGAVVFGLRVKAGDDASCLNLYQARQPRILGVPDPLARRGGFRFAASKASGEAPPANPWLLLEEDLGTDHDGTPRLPVILDEATAKYSLHLWKGVGATYDITDGRGQTIRLEVVGLLANSIFQGDLLLSETALLRCFPEVNGFRFFLVDCPHDQAEQVGAVLERVLGDYGLGTETAATRLNAFMAVQNTYLFTFQSLGGLGLLLGTFGLAAVQLRNILERRRELALMRAVGFRRASLVGLVTLENAALLLAGVMCGVGASLIALLPHLLWGGASVPWAWLAGSLVVVLAVGLLAGLAAVATVLAAPLLGALRGE